MDLTKLNLRPASFYIEYLKRLEDETDESFFDLPKNTQDAVFNYDYTLYRSNETLALLSANYYERFSGDNLYCKASPVAYMSDENQAKFIYMCLVEEKPWEYYYPKHAKRLEEIHKDPNTYY